MSDRETPKLVEAVGNSLSVASGSATADVRRNFSIPHLQAAEHFTRELISHEEANAGAGWGPHFDRSTWNATAAITLSFSAIEGALDEAEDDLGLPVELTNVFKRSPTLDRALAILSHRGCQPFDRGMQPFQDAELLRKLRNGLVHPKAEWDSARERNAQLGRAILGARLPLSPFQPDPNLAFPHGLMSAGVAQWAVNTARTFIREFRARLGLPPTV